jgi:hypothetical protein
MTSRRALRDLRRRVFELAGSRRYSRPAPGGLDDKLARYLDFDNGFFIEAGANDGFAQSNACLQPYYDRVEQLTNDDHLYRSRTVPHATR